MHAHIKLTILQGEERCMGVGPYKLLRLTSQVGSLRQAALTMGMSYSKAHAIVKRLERVLKCPVLNCKVGGVSGGGAQLTEYGERWLDEYERFSQEVERAASVAFKDFCERLNMKGTVEASGYESARGVAE